MSELIKTALITGGSKGIGYGKDNITIQLQDIAPGAYYITAIGQQNIATGSFIVTQ